MKGRQQTFRIEQQELASAEVLGARHTPVTPRPAAGVILVRDTTGGPEVLLLQRRADARFAAGAYVFPGGTLDEDDNDPAWMDLLVPPSSDAIAGAADPGGPPELTYVVAALRETFEETGVLLTSDSTVEPTERAALRAALVAGERRFFDIVSGLGVRLAADRLVLCARWITPESLSRRYDARFFLQEVPGDVEISPEPSELVGHVWISPSAALDRYFDSSFRMLFPTAKTLSWLEEGDSVAEWRERFLRREIRPICPRLRWADGEVISVIPGEPRYDEKEGDG